MKVLRFALPCFALLFATCSSSLLADTVNWTGNGDGVNWTDGANWDRGDGAAPQSGDTVNIVTGNVVTLDVGNGFMPSGGAEVNIDGTLNHTIFRASGATINVGSTAMLVAGSANQFHDWNGGTVTWESGASIFGTWENKAATSHTFVFDAAGFATLTPERYFLSTAGAADATEAAGDDTWVVDLTNYAGGPGTFDLVTFTSDTGAINSTTFSDYNFSVIGGSGTFSYDDGSDTIQFTIAVPEPGTLVVLAGLGMGVFARRRRGC